MAEVTVHDFCSEDIKDVVIVTWVILLGNQKVIKTHRHKIIVIW